MLDTVRSYLVLPPTPVGALSLDLLIVGALIAVLFLFGSWMGKARLASLFFAIPIAAFGFFLFPFTDRIMLFGDSTRSVALSRLLIFLALVVVGYLLASSVIYAYSSHSRGGRWFDYGVLATATAALFIAVYHHPLQLTALYRFGPSLEALFRSETVFWWVAGSFIAFFISVRR